MCIISENSVLGKYYLRKVFFYYHVKGGIIVKLILDVEKVELLALRKCWGLSDVQKAAGLASQTLYNVKRGRSLATPRTIGRVARALDVDPREILKDA